MGVKQQLILYYNQWSTIKILKDSIPFKITWQCFKVNQIQSKQKLKIKIDINNFTDGQADLASAL